MASVHICREHHTIVHFSYNTSSDQSPSRAKMKILAFVTTILAMAGAVICKKYLVWSEQIRNSGQISALLPVGRSCKAARPWMDGLLAWRCLYHLSDIENKTKRVS